MTAEVLDVEGFSKDFFLHEQAKQIPSAHNVSLSVRTGELTALVGPTGSGKSTVLKGIYRTYLPRAGRILYRTKRGATEDLTLVSEHRMLELRRTEISFVTQFLRFLPRQPTLDVVAQPLYQRGVGTGAGRERARTLLGALNVPERLWGISPATFSGGEKQRVNLARGLAAKPRLLLLDEPTASLDPGATDRAVQLIRELKEEGTGMLAVFHDPKLVERLADQVARLDPPRAEEELPRS